MMWSHRSFGSKLRQDRTNAPRQSQNKATRSTCWISYQKKGTFIEFSPTFIDFSHIYNRKSCIYRVFADIQPVISRVHLNRSAVGHMTPQTGSKQHGGFSCTFLRHTLYTSRSARYAFANELKYCTLPRIQIRRFKWLLGRHCRGPFGEGSLYHLLLNQQLHAVGLISLSVEFRKSNH